MFSRTLLLVSLLFSIPWAAASEPDHPLLDRYPDAGVLKVLQVEYEQYLMPSGAADEKGVIPRDSLVGDLSMIFYEIEGVSSLKVYENYKSALERLGAVTVASCELDQCGSSGNSLKAFGAALSARGSVYNYYHKPYFLRSRLDSAKGVIHVALFIGSYDGEVAVQQVILEQVPQENQLIDVSNEYLGKSDDSSAEEITRTEKQKANDHPLIARYPGAKLEDSRKVEYEQIDIPMGVGEGASHRALTGDLSQHYYLVKNVSTLKLVENYRAAIERLGFEIEYECSLDACGNARSSAALGASVAVRGSVYNDHGKPYYLVARDEKPQGSVTVAVYIGGDDGDAAIQQLIVEEKGTQTDLVTVNADQLYKDIQQSGKALVYGIYFDTDSATVKPESAEALQAITDLLESHPDLNLYVVGHTDDTGEGDYNLSLSSRRAASVVDRLKTDYAIEAPRLKPAGVGPYAPVAGNESDEGRRLNRRVELVRRL